MKQLEEWTDKKCEKVIFDSTKDNWSQNSSVFDSKVINKSNLMFVIEDTNRNKFGGYVTSTINQRNNYINDSNSFLFSLKSNGRINGMMKFEVQSNYEKNAFYLDQKSNTQLFRFGPNHTILVYKENSKGSSYNCHDNNYYNFHGATSAFFQNSNNNTNSQHYTPKRITVIQMN